MHSGSSAAVLLSGAEPPKGHPMPQRLAFQAIAPDPCKAVMALEKYIHACGLEHKLIHLLKLRASQINGCAFCIDMHSKDARANGEEEHRLYAFSAWRETTFFNDRERAALDWTEAVTRIADSRAEDEQFNNLRHHFSEKEVVDLTWIIAAINLWNRLAISFRLEPGHYRPPRTTAPPVAAH